VSDGYDYDDDACECANCGGEGFTYGCSWDWQCDTYDEGEGTCLCTRRCEWCNPLTAAELAERQKLRQKAAIREGRAANTAADDFYDRLRTALPARGLKLVEVGDAD